ncbi:MAG: hypothetical protein AB1746_16795, partial [Candidatus Zixiibacteriota bacterium]
EPQKGDNLFLVKPIESLSSDYKFDYGELNGRDSLLFVNRLIRLRNILDSTGKKMLDEYCDLDTNSWHSILKRGEIADFNNEIALINGNIIRTRDSTYFFLLFSSRSEYLENFKIFLHQYDTDGNKVNFDFLPVPRTHTWVQWDQYLCIRALPNEPGSFRYSLGFFNEEGRLGNPVNGRFDHKSTDNH